MKRILLYLCCIVALTACSSDDGNDTMPVGPAYRTVVVYMSAENNLSGYAQADIYEMIQGRKQAPANDNLVLFVDKASEQEKPFIAKVTTDNKLDTLWRYETDFLASDPKNMTRVLKDCITLCPALVDYGLVLWGHANGWVIENDSVATDSPATPRRAYGMDSGDNQPKRTGTWINIPSLRQVLEDVGVTWKFIFADCCNMANIETAYELRGVTQWLIGSPAEIPGGGAPYTTVVKDFFIYDDTEMYTSICNDYYAQPDDIGGHTPLAVIKTAQTPALATATRPLLSQVDAFLRTPNSTEGMIYYYAYNRSKEMEKTLYDMNDVFRTALGATTPEYQQWKGVFDQTVVYSKLNTRWFNLCVVLSDFVETRGGENVFKHGNEAFGGVSMFFPMEKYNTAGISHPYNESIKKMAWYHAVGWSAVGW